VIHELIVRFGLVAVYIGSAVEGDIVPLLGGVVSRLGLMNLPLVIGLAAAGCFTGDLAWYFAGRHRSDAIRDSRIYRSFGPRVELLAARVGPWQIAVSRLVYGTRIASMLFWGAHRLSLPKFVLIDLIGCTIWAVLLGTLGYVGSTAAMVFFGELKRVEFWLLCAAAASLVIFLGIKFASSKARRPADEERRVP
jgi:membrane protein DedA with SNARE-associated domain